MKILYSDEDITKEDSSESVFLAGPTPRDTSIFSWRKGAIEILEIFGYEGLVLVPERKDWKIQFDYTDQVEWEDYGLNHAKKIVFWMPRKMVGMPALTSNVEFGRMVCERPGAVIYGRPEDAEHCRYLDWFYTKYQPFNKIYTTLHATLGLGLDLLV